MEPHRASVGDLWKHTFVGDDPEREEGEFFLIVERHDDVPAHVRYDYVVLPSGKRCFGHLTIERTDRLNSHCMFKDLWEKVA